MAIISCRRLSDKTLKKYLELEAAGQLTEHQRRALAGHRALPVMVDIARLSVKLNAETEKGNEQS